MRQLWMHSRHKTAKKPLLNTRRPVHVPRQREGLLESDNFIVQIQHPAFDALTHEISVCYIEAVELQPAPEYPAQQHLGVLQIRAVKAFPIPISFNLWADPDHWLN